MNLYAWHICIIYLKTHGKAGVKITCLAPGMAISALALSKPCWKFHFHNCRKFSGTNTISAAKNIERRPKPPTSSPTYLKMLVHNLGNLKNVPKTMAGQHQRLIGYYLANHSQFSDFNHVRRCNYSWNRYVCAIKFKRWNVQYTPWTTYNYVLHAYSHQCRRNSKQCSWGFHSCLCQDHSQVPLIPEHIMHLYFHSHTIQ